MRALDAGGWSDTWFAGHGAVCNLSLQPGAEVYAGMTPTGWGPPEVQLRVPDFEEQYAFCPDSPPHRHPLLEAAIRRWAPAGCSLEVTVSSAVPPGSSLGTSAAVAVALIAALQSLAGNELVPKALARAAHDVETVDLARQSGVQDQVAAAFGGANLVRIDPYPEFDVTPVALSPSTMASLTRRVVTVYLGGAHDSSALHKAVIDRLAGDKAAAERLMGPLRDAAARAAHALANGDLQAYGEAMITNTESQAALHPALVSPLARQVVEIAARSGAVGWKVNGAGGPGGTVTLLLGADAAAEDLVHALQVLQGPTVLPLRPAAEGAHIVEQG